MSLTGLILSGGGTRGAYEVGVLMGIISALGKKPGDSPPFQILVGSSVGAINAAWLAAHSDRGDMDIAGLSDLWRSLKPAEFLRVSRSGWRRLRGKGSVQGDDGSKDTDTPRAGGSLLDPLPLELLVHDRIDWERLHANISAGRIRALVVPALEVSHGVTTMFCEPAPGVEFRSSHDPQRRGIIGPLSPQHILASAAIPVLYPARRVGDGLYFDGGLRFNTPIAPAIRLGARRLAIVSPIKTSRDLTLTETRDPTLGFLAGKLFNAVLLDPIGHDLQVLDRFNALVTILEDALTPDELARVQAVIAAQRGVPYHRLERLVISPTADLGRIGTEHLRAHLDEWGLDRVTRWILRKAVGGPESGEADWTSFVLFDGQVAEILIGEGYRDAMARADEVRAFWG
ncbi:MAG: hypothetical protein GXP62_20050 [Oligoflexia bacterium]|nr:hypothetical protein [Oligoflexia bacterium]